MNDFAKLKFGRRGLIGVIAGILLCVFVAPRAGRAASGEEIYRNLCARCHGDQGQGVKGKRAQPLTGDWSVKKLTEVIAKTMPDDDPGKCAGPDAEKVAQYIHAAFYSPDAQARLHPPRIELQRLTNRQFLNSVADLFRNDGDDRANISERGLAATYYNARNFQKDKKVFSRTDATVNFQFGESTPEEGKFGKDEFSIQWNGALLPVETGEYEFVIKTENGARLWVNDIERNLIDGWVASGPLREQKAALRLIGGRAYPLRLDFFKFKEKSASISLQWKPPGGVQEVIPRRCLRPGGAPTTRIVNTPFPPDDSSTGYERGASVSAAWDDGVTSAAIEVANGIVARLDTLTRTKPGATDRAEKVRQFCSEFVERAFRRPLNAEEKKLYIESQFAAAKDPETAVKRVVLLTLKSPRFLYPDTAGEADDYTIATRLALTLWDSLPDAALVKAAAQGSLHTREQVAAQAARMADDPRTRAKVREALLHWLQAERPAEIPKNATNFPGFDPAMVADLRTSLELFLDDAAWDGTGNFRKLLLADHIFANDRIAKFYGFPAPEKAGDFEKVSLKTEPRAGVVTHPYLLALFAYHNTTSPIHRGVFLTRSVAGRILKPPPIAVAFKDEEFDPNLSMREKIVRLTRDATCTGCHSIINPLGFTLENYDAAGRFRREEKGRAIDASGEYPAASGDTVRLQGARELAEYAVKDPHAQENFVEQIFTALVKQPVRAYGPAALTQFRRQFAENEFSVRKLVVEIATLSATRGTATKTASN